MKPEFVEMLETNTGFEWTPLPNTKPQRYITRIDDEGLLTIPEEILKVNGWCEGDMLEFTDNQNGSFSIQKSNDCTIRQKTESN